MAIAGTRTAARLFVHHRAGMTVIEPGSEAEVLASLPLALLDAFAGSRDDPCDDGPQLGRPTDSNEHA